MREREAPGGAQAAVRRQDMGCVEHRVEATVAAGQRQIAPAFLARKWLTAISKG